MILPQFSLPKMTSTPSSRSASSSPSSSVSFSLNSKGCILGILNRILRFRSLSTYPSDHLFQSHSNFQELEEAKQSKQSSLVTPTLVARLMGLDTIPSNTPIQSPDSITRSFSDQNQVQCGHRRVKSSSSRCSISEMNGFFEFENDDFLVLNFAESKKKSSKSKNKKPENGISNSDEVFESEKIEFRKRRRRKKKNKNIMKKKKTRVEDECSSEESSPVSVLDFDQFLTDHHVHRSELGTNSVEPISRRRLSSELEASGFQLESTIRRIDTNLMENRMCEVEILNELCKMAGDEIAESTWFYREGSRSKNVLKRHEDYEEICVDLESQIVDLCLVELVQELVEPT